MCFFLKESYYSLWDSEFLNKKGARSGSILMDGVDWTQFDLKWGRPGKPK